MVFSLIKNPKYITVKNSYTYYIHVKNFAISQKSPFSLQKIIFQRCEYKRKNVQYNKEKKHIYFYTCQVKLYKDFFLIKTTLSNAFSKHTSTEP